MSRLMIMAICYIIRQSVEIWLSQHKKKYQIKINTAHIIHTPYEYFIRIWITHWNQNFKPDTNDEVWRCTINLGGGHRSTK